MGRQEGYYWVKFDNEFIIAKWYSNYWSIIRSLYFFEDSDFDHINEHRIKNPGELPE